MMVAMFHAADRIALCACALAGCGRVAFDAQPRGDAGRDVTLDAPRDAPPPNAPVFVQHTAATTGGIGAVLSATFVEPVAAGDLIVAAFDYNAGIAHVARVSDTGGDAYAILGPYDGGGFREYVAYAIASGSGAETVTVQLDAAATDFLELRIHEYAGVSPTEPFDAAASASGTTTAAASAPITTTSPDELVFGMVIDGIVSPGAGFTLRGNDYNDVTEDRIAVTPGTYQATATTISSWNATVVAFRGG